ncbi:N-acetylmuramoyl-L-alanine amidase [Acetivibrio cellulolyticus]|uniref:N-acetylmuramoyl-L-alanine amidase n=1 Tax=Acetivibrio cellulolyticus TaxID=35830 RepID=UPI0001E2E33E|nr:N-acetylmuramoyl-L-alanine amidase [Acetivibrio cellulolyticus]
MKKLVCIYLMLFTFLITGISTYAQDLLLKYDGSTHSYKGNIFKLMVNGETVTSDIPPIIINGRSLVPVRAVFEKLGATVSWDSKSQKVTVAYSGNNVELKINDSYALINGIKSKMEVPAKVINDRTMVPLRFVGEQLNMEVAWDANKGEIAVNSKKTSELSRLNNINYIKGKSGQSVTIDLDKFQNYRIMRLPSPDRVIVDFTNTKVVSEKQSIVVNEELLKTVKCSQFEGNTARVVLELEGQPQYQVTENKNQLLLNIQKGVPSTSSGNTGTQLPADGVVVPADNQLSVKHIDKTEYEAVVIGVKDCTGYKAFKLSTPDRIVIDLPKAIASKEQQTIDIDSALIKSVRYAGKDADGARVVIDTKTALQYKLVESNGSLIAYVAKSIDLISSTTSRGEVDRAEENKLSVSYKNEENHEKVKMSLNDYSGYNIIKQLELNRIVIDFPNSSAPSIEQKINIKSSQIENIRYAGVNNSSSRVIIQLIAQCQYVVVEEAGALTINIIPSVTGDVSQTDDDQTSATTKVTPKPTVVVTPKSTMTVTPTPTAIVTAKPINTGSEDSIKIEYNYSEGTEKVIIWAKDCKSYNIWRITGPDRIVLDIPNYKAGKEQKLDISSSNISSIRSAQFEETTARVVIDVIGQPQYKAVKSDEQIVLTIEKPLYKNITYSNSGDRVYFTLNGAKLTEGGEELKKLYTDKYDYDNRLYTVTFPSELADLGSGIIDINDNIVNDVNVETNADTKQTTLVFSTKERFNYEIITRASENNTTITLLKEISNKDQLVVIDAGHGGSDPGASYGGVYEKDLNLDIAKRLNKLLESKGIKTYMTREDDSFVGLYERAYIANNMNATLFISIHNNAYHSKYKGTETLYYPSSADSTGFSGKRFAELIQNEMVNDLGTYDRGIVERPNLVVLKATKMPAALAEVAFLTNSGDLAKLKSEEFRQKAAQALCDAILQSLEEVK